MTERQFFRGFIAALREGGVKEIATSGGDHHRRFAEAAAVLASARQSGDPGAAELPLLFASSTVNSRFPRFNTALLDLQSEGFVAAPNPNYHRVMLVLEEPRARDVLSRFNEPERDLLARAAEAFKNADAPDEERLAEVH